jgi:hypothetical protein
VIATTKTAFTLGFLYVISTHQFLAWQAGIGFSHSVSRHGTSRLFLRLSISSYFELPLEFEM